MNSTPIATAASTSAMTWTVVEPDTASALRNSPELKSRPCPKPRPTAAHSSSPKPMIRPIVQTSSWVSSPSGPKNPSTVPAVDGESRRANARHGPQRARRKPRAIRGSRRTRRGSMKVTKNSESISAIRTSPRTAAATRLSWPLELRRGAARPLDDLAVRGRRARRVLLPALRASDRRRGRTGARRAGRRRGAALPLRLRRDHGARARAARARADDRACGGLLLRNAAPLPGARALGRPLRRVRPDRPSAQRSRSSLALGDLEPVPDDAGLRGRGRLARAPCGGLDRGDARLPAAARARRQLRRAQRDEVPRRPFRRAARRGRLRLRR